MQKTYIIIIVLILVAGGLFFGLRSKNLEAPMPTDQNQVGDNFAPESPATTTIITTTTTPPDVQVVKEFTVSGQNFSFTPSLLTVKKGDKVRITFKNTDGSHDLRIDEFNVNTGITKSGEQKTVEFTADKAGSFQYYCSIGTHRAMGMWGTLKVE